jgi:peptidoglycan/xylan/chitin deacetylase (PgdA/CDA1 family)
LKYAPLVRVLARLSAAARVDSGLNCLLERYIYRPGPDEGRATWRRRRYQVLVYHKVTADQHPFFRGIDPGAFDSQMQLLRRFYRVYPLRELVERAAEGDVPGKSVAVTFDDGYEDNYLNAFPILRRYDLPATIFLATGCIGNGNVLWHDRVFDAFRHTEVKQARWKSCPEIEVDLSTRQATLSSLRATLKHARSMDPDGREGFVEEIENTLRTDPSKVRRTPMLSWEQAREMAGEGISFGSHSVTHPILTRTSKPRMAAELMESKAEIEARVGIPVHEFAYPNGQSGDYDGEVKDALRRTGYFSAVTTIPGLNFAGSDPFELRRGQPWTHDPHLYRLLFFLQRHGLHQ